MEKVIPVKSVESFLYEILEITAPLREKRETMQGPIMNLTNRIARFQIELGKK